MKDELDIDALVLPREFLAYVAEIRITDMLLCRYLTGRDGDFHEPMDIVRIALLHELESSRKALAKQSRRAS